MSVSIIDMRASLERGALPVDQQLAIYLAEEEYFYMGNHAILLERKEDLELPPRRHQIVLTTDIVMVGATPNIDRVTKFSDHYPPKLPRSRPRLGCSTSVVDDPLRTGSLSAIMAALLAIVIQRRAQPTCSTARRARQGV